MPLFITPVISCRHNRSYIYSEFVEPEIDASCKESVSAILRATWPVGGLFLGLSGIHILTQSIDASKIQSSPSMRYLGSETGFSIDMGIPRAVGLKEFVAIGVHVQACAVSSSEEIYVFPPVVRKPVDELHSRRSRSNSIDDILGKASSFSAHEDSPFAIQTAPSHHVVICPRCKDICSVNDQRRVGQAQDYMAITSNASNQPTTNRSVCKTIQLREGSALLEDNRESTKSESIQSFISSLSSQSETSRAVRDSVTLSANPMTPVRRSSCPDVLSVQRSTLSSYDNFREPATVINHHRPTLSLLRTSHVFSQPPIVPNNSVSSIHSDASEKMKRRIKQSLSRISESAKSRGGSETSKRSSSHRRDSGATVNFDNTLPLSECSEENIQDLLSPISHRSNYEQENNLGTLRISASGMKPRATPIVEPSNRPSPSPFVPSDKGKELMNIFNHSVKPQDMTSQNLMWDTFIRCARGPVEFADIRDRMPTVVYCLRGLIRFADPEFASQNRTDVIPYIFALLLGRHSVTGENVSIEAVDCCCTILTMLAIDPLSKTSPNNIRPRQSFQKALLNQNCMILQQLVGSLVHQLPRWVSAETLYDPQLIVTSRIVASILDLLFLYIFRLREHWFTAAPQQFKDLLPRLMASIADKFPTHTERIVGILDVILDHANPSNCRQVGQILKSAITKSNPTESVNGTLNRWATVGGPGQQPTTEPRQLSNLFGLLRSTKSLKHPSYSAKTLVIHEIKTAGATL